MVLLTAEAITSVALSADQSSAYPVSVKVLVVPLYAQPYWTRTLYVVPFTRLAVISPERIRCVVETVPLFAMPASKYTPCKPEYRALFHRKNPEPVASVYIGDVVIILAA